MGVFLDVFLYLFLVFASVVFVAYIIDFAYDKFHAVHGKRVIKYPVIYNNQKYKVIIRNKEYGKFYCEVKKKVWIFKFFVFYGAYSSCDFPGFELWGNEYIGIVEYVMKRYIREIEIENSLKKHEQIARNKLKEWDGIICGVLK